MKIPEKIEFGTMVEMTKQQTNREHFSEIPVRTKCVVIKEVDLPGYDLLVVFDYKPCIHKHIDNYGNFETSIEIEHYTGYLERGSWFVLPIDYIREREEKEIPQFVKDRVKDMKFEEVWNGKEGYVGQKHQSDCCKAEVIVCSGEEGTGHWECKKCGKACNDTFIAEQKESDWQKVDKEILALLKHLSFETALYRNRPQEEYEIFPYPEFHKIHEAINSLLSKTREEERVRIREIVEGMTFKDIGSTFTLDLTKEAAETGFNRTQIYLLNQIKT